MNCQFQNGALVHKTKGYHYEGTVCGTFPYPNNPGGVPFVNVQHVDGWVMHFRENELAAGPSTRPREDLLTSDERAFVEVNRQQPEPNEAMLIEILDRFAPGAGVGIEQKYETHGLDTQSMVRFYERDFYPLSNFSAFRIKWRGLTFDTSEMVYHWEKFAGAPEIQELIINAPSSHEAFRSAIEWKDRRRPDWDAIKVETMRWILRCKVQQHEYVRRKLLATGDRLLVEDSWRDDFWGWGPTRGGQNMLGKLWMEIRAEIRAEGSPT